LTYNKSKGISTDNAMDSYSVLILFKDDLAKVGKGEGKDEEEGGFPIPIKSETIQEHLNILGSKNDKKSKSKDDTAQNSLSLEKSNVKIAKAKEIDGKYFVWGWWKKPGESHNKMFRILKDICDKGENINALLYNRYMRRSYTAKIHDIYYVPFASTISIPRHWESRCPPYYLKKHHLCGAYFLMELNTELKDNASPNGKRTNVDVEYEDFIDGNVEKIIPYKNPQIVLKEFFVDKDTFDDIFLKDISVISQAEGVIEKSNNIVDKEIVPLSLKLTDQTIFLLRETTKIEKFRDLFETGQEENINDEIKDLSKNDAIDFIKEMTRKDWEKLYSLKETINEIGKIFQNNNMPVTATDIRLVSCLINEKVLDSADKLSDLEMTIINWMLSDDYKKQREEAARFFSLAWEHSIKMGMPKDEGYFDKLPQHEDISSSKKKLEGNYTVTI
jgi:hypothetical protein